MKPQTSPSSIEQADLSESETAITDNVALQPVCANAVSADAQIYGSFLVGDAEFALSVCSVQEVVNAPDGYSSIPLAPDYLLGVFSLRGIIVPVIDMRKIFDIATKSDQASMACVDARKVAIIEHGNFCLGLLFDNTCEVFNAQDKEQSHFTERGHGVARQIIAGVFKMNQGRRIVQILDVHALLNLENIPRTANKKRSAHHRGPRRQCISFNVGDSCCALNISAIKEIVNIGAIENKVLAGNLCLGAIDIRGNTVPIVNFSRLLGCPDHKVDKLHESDDHRVIVMKVDQNLFGLLVSDVKSIVSYFDDELKVFPVLGKQKTDMFAGCIEGAQGAEHTIVLKHDRILSNEDVAQITKGHCDLFTDKDAVQNVSNKNTHDRKKLLTFSLGSQYGLDISEVQEVIDFPEELVQTPNLPSHILGMVNLRGSLVAVIDARVMYELGDTESTSDKKVLVFESAGDKNGLVVDSVDSIIPFSAGDAVAIPSVVHSKAASAISDDVKQAILLPNGSKKNTVCIFDLAALASRANTAC